MTTEPGPFAGLPERRASALRRLPVACASLSRSVAAMRAAVGRDASARALAGHARDVEMAQRRLLSASADATELGIAASAGEITADCPEWAEMIAREFAKKDT